MIAGGPSGGTFLEILQTVEDSIAAGGAGVCMGRQVFSSDDPKSRVSALRAVIHDGVTAAEASERLGGK